MPVHLQPVEKRVSLTLAEVAADLPPESLTIRMLLARLGEQGLLLSCIIVCLPYLIPVSLPGMSTLSGILVALVGVALATGTVPWLPKRLLDHSLPADRFRKLLEWSARRFKGVEHLIKPRALWLTSGRVMNGINGGLLVLNGFLLMWPSVAPLMNTLPGVAAMCLAAGILERDGMLIVVGYVLTLVAAVYFAGVTIMWLVGASWLAEWFGIFGEPMPTTAPVT